MLFNSPSPVTSHTAAVPIERTMARLKNERSNHSRVIKMPLILACPFNRKKYLCTKGVDLKVLVFLVNLCQPVCPEKECDLFWQTAQSHFAELWRGFACLKDNVAQRDIPRRLHSSGSRLALQKMAVRLATCICLCRISQTRENKTALWAAGVKVLREQVVAISTKITWSNMFFCHSEVL